MDIKSSAAIAGAPPARDAVRHVASQPAVARINLRPAHKSSRHPAGQKCEVDAKRVCQEMRNRTGSRCGNRADAGSATEREQNSSRTDSRFVSYPIPNGSVVEVQCDINTEHNTVVYAHLMPGPALTPDRCRLFQKRRLLRPLAEEGDEDSPRRVSGTRTLVLPRGMRIAHPPTTADNSSPVGETSGQPAIRASRGTLSQHPGAMELLSCERWRAGDRCRPGVKRGRASSREVPG